MKFKRFLFEKEKAKFKIGDRIKVKPHGADYNEDTANKTGVVVAIHYFNSPRGLPSEYEVGVSLNDFKNGHYLNYGTNGETGIKNTDIPIGSGWWGYPSDFELLGSKSKYVRQLKFEAYEPGQEPYEQHDRYVINVPSEIQSRKLQEFLFKNGFSWGNRKIYQSNALPIYKNKSCINIDFKDKSDLGYSGKDFYVSERGRKYNNRDKVYSLKEFFENMEEDNRIKIKPSQIKKGEVI